jgi:hypothetical protein
MELRLRELRSVHGIDEAISIENFERMIVFYQHLLAASPPDALPGASE